MCVVVPACPHAVNEWVISVVHPRVARSHKTCVWKTGRVLVFWTFIFNLRNFRKSVIALFPFGFWVPTKISPKSENEGCDTTGLIGLVLCRLKRKPRAASCIVKPVLCFVGGRRALSPRVLYSSLAVLVGVFLAGLGRTASRAYLVGYTGCQIPYSGTNLPVHTLVRHACRGTVQKGLVQDCQSPKGSL